MMKHEFDLKTEALDAQIRVEQVKGKTHDLTKAKHEVAIKEANAKQTGVKAQIASQQVITEQSHLTTARHESKVAKLQAESKEQDVRQLTRENPLRQRLLDIKYDSLQTDTKTADKVLNQRKQYLGQQGNL